MKYNTPIAISLVIMLTLSFCPVANGMAEEIKSVSLNQEIGSVEERRILVSLQEERKKLQEKEKVLAARELELKSLQAEVDKKLNELKDLKEDVQKLLTRKEEEETKKIRDLGKVYEKMDPRKAAQLIPSLKKDLAIGILANMKKKAAAKIFNNMERDKALLLSKSFPLLKPD